MLARPTLAGAWLAMVLCSPLPSIAELREDVLEVPVAVQQGDGTTLRQNVLLTVLHEDVRRAAPYALVLHGRPTQASEFARMGRVRYPANAAWLVSRGFTVLIPTRIGYGLSGGPDLEYTGECRRKTYDAALASVGSEADQVLRWAAGHGLVALRHGVVIGESFGGLAALALAAHPLPGMVAAFNFAGGDGGDFSHIGQPCQPERLGDAIAGFGRINRVPVLWLYSENDLLWGPSWPEVWFRAFAAVGGRGRFERLPSSRTNGHFLFNQATQLWQPRVTTFLVEQGLGDHGAVR